MTSLTETNVEKLSAAPPPTPIKPTLVVNLFAGPGTGKSTTAAGVFSQLKLKNYNAELVHEFAKDLVWENRSAALSFQPYVLAKQMWHIHRLLGQVEIIVTDAPILLSGLIYGQKDGGYDLHSVQSLALNTFLKWHTLNFFLVRDDVAHPFNSLGRTHSIDESKELDTKIFRMLEGNCIPFVIPPAEDHIEWITRKVELNLL